MTIPGPNERRYSRKVRGTGGSRGRHRLGAHGARILVRLACARRTDRTESPPDPMPIQPSRREFLAAGAARGGRAARRLGAEPALSRPVRPHPRSELHAVPRQPGQGGAARHGVPLVRGPGVVRRRPLSRVERHPEQPAPEMGGGNGRGQRVPPAVALRQRQHARPPGTAADLRARRAAGDADGIRRHDHRDRRTLRGQAAELAQRRRVPLRRLRLVHGPAVRRAELLRRARGDAGAADQRLPRRSAGRPAGGGRRRHQPAERARLLAGRVEALRGRGRRLARARCGPSTWRSAARGCRTSGS